jgi:hypothetical protein
MNEDYTGTCFAQQWTSAYNNLSCTCVRHVVAFAEVNRRQLDCLRSCVLFLALELTQCPRALLSPVAVDVPFRIEEGGHREGGYALVSGSLEMLPADGAAI